MEKVTKRLLKIFFTLFIINIAVAVSVFPYFPGETKNILFFIPVIQLIGLGGGILIIYLTVLYFKIYGKLIPFYQKFIIWGNRKIWGAQLNEDNIFPFTTHKIGALILAFSTIVIFINGMPFLDNDFLQQRGWIPIVALGLFGFIAWFFYIRLLKDN